jgi:hypothetical protein
MKIKYHIIKSTRTYNGLPYSGLSNDGAPAESASYMEAIELAVKLNERNPIGWNIYEVKSGNLIHRVYR